MLGFSPISFLGFFSPLCPERERVGTRGLVSQALPKAPACPAGVLGVMLVLRP